MDEVVRKVESDSLVDSRRKGRGNKRSCRLVLKTELEVADIFTGRDVQKGNRGKPKKKHR